MKVVYPFCCCYASIKNKCFFKVSSHHEDSAGLPSSGGLLHGHHGSASVPQGSQPEGFTGVTFSSRYLPVLYSMSKNCNDCLLSGLFLVLSVFYKVFVLSSFVSEPCAGLPGNINRSAAAIKQELNEDDENCSMTDKSEDEKKEMRSRPRTRCPESF